MPEFLHQFLLCFIPMFVALDPLGLLPLFVSVTSTMDRERRRRVVLQAVPTALAIGVAFILLGRPLLDYLEIGVPDLQIAGGSLLFIWAMWDLAMSGKPSVNAEESVGLVPLATPLMVGPAVLTLGLVLTDKYQSPWPPVAALTANLAILAAMLLGLERLINYVPLTAMRAISKVVDLLLAAIGVAFVRAGVTAAVLAARG